MMRVNDWENRLSTYLESVWGMAFCYGRHDCALFAAGAVMAMTGTDFAAEYRGKYRSAAGSIRALKLYGHGTLEATIDALFADRQIAFARRGDLVMFSGSLGVCIGEAALFVTETQAGDHHVVAQGLERVPRDLWDKAWCVE